MKCTRPRLTSGDPCSGPVPAVALPDPRGFAVALMKCLGSPAEAKPAMAEPDVASAVVRIGPVSACGPISPRPTVTATSAFRAQHTDKGRASGGLSPAPYDLHCRGQIFVPQPSSLIERHQKVKCPTASSVGQIGQIAAENSPRSFPKRREFLVLPVWGDAPAKATWIMGRPRGQNAGRQGQLGCRRRTRLPLSGGQAATGTHLSVTRQASSVGPLGPDHRSA